MAHIPARDQWKRLGLALLGRWKTKWQPDRRSSHDGYWGEIGHAAKNIPIEWIREFIPGLARKGKKHEEQVPYDWDA